MGLTLLAACASEKLDLMPAPGVDLSGRWKLTTPYVWRNCATRRAAWAERMALVDRRVVAAVAGGAAAADRRPAGLARASWQWCPCRR